MTSTDARLLPLRVFLSSPGDVTAERDKARQVVDHLQFDPFIRGRIAFDLVSWDDPRGGALVTATETPQESINRGLPRPSECDVVVVILWSRMGTPLPYPEYQRPDGSRYLSGTDWEYEDAVQAGRSPGGPVVLVYRRTTKAAIDPNDPKASQLLHQNAQVKEFFDRMRDPTSGTILRGHKKYASPDEFRTMLEYDLRSLTHRILTHASQQAGLAEADLPPFWDGSPFPGLRAFTPHDEPIFFGRGREIDELVDMVLASDFVAVVGASGSGKSSLVGAGLLPRLAVEQPRMRLPMYDVRGKRWARLRCTPAERGDDPFTALSAALEAPAGTADLLRSTPSAILEVVPECVSLIFVDQFEEMFTSVDPQWIQPFVELIAAAAQSGRCKVVTTLRADFYHRCLEIPGLTHLMERGQLPLSAPSETLLEMITRPAERAGLRFEEGLPGRILRDTGTDPGSLPLLAYTLDELYHADTADKLLDVSTYESLGGVQGAIGTRADVAFSRLDRETQAVFARVFRELVTVDDTGRAARRRSRLSSITGGAAALRLVTAFTEARLLVQSRDEENQPVVFVAHEALFGSWRRMADWISSARDDLLLQRRVASAANDWEAHGRDDAYRWPHERLVDVYAMLERTGVELDPVAASFVEPEYTRIFPILADPGVEQHRRRYAIDRLVTIGPATVPGLLTLLRSGTPVGRTSAGAALARLGDSAVDGLVGVLDVADPDVRLEAVSALRLVGGSGVVIGLAEAVRDEDARVRSAALGALSAVGGPEAREIIATALTDLESDVRWQAAGALGAFGPEAVPHLLSIAGPDDVSVETAQRAMLAIGERGLPQLYDGLRADDAGIQLRAAEVLARIGTAAVPGLVEAVSDADSGVRWRAADVLAAIPVPAELTAIVRRALTAALADADPGVRSAAVYAVARAGGPDAVADVIRMFADDAEEVRWAASDAVSAIGPTVVAQLLGTMEAAVGESALASAALTRVSSSPELIGELGRHPGWVNDRIEEVVADAGHDVLDDLVDLLGRHDTTVRGAAARTLAQIGRPALLRLIACLEDAEPGVRGSAAWTVGVIAANTRNDPSPTSAALQPLEAMLADVDRDCRSAAADALGAFGEDALPALWRGLRSSTPTHREAARRLSRSLGPIGVPGLLILARENNKVTREAATQCLRELRGPGALFGLAELHGTEESHVST